MGVDLRIWAVVNGVYQDVLHLREVKGVHRGGPRGAEGVLVSDQRHMDGWIEPVVRFRHALHPPMVVLTHLRPVVTPRAFMEGAAGWSATRLEPEGGSQGQGFDSSTLR